ncbi:MAG: hypothetical protein AMXMBFR48_13280 [Ignavibacteriales bacterium]
MKMLQTLFFFFAFFASSIFAQDWTWSLRQSGQSLGNPVAVRKADANIVYYGSVGTVYISYDRGESFSTWGTTIPTSTRIKHVILTAKDTSSMVVACEASPKDIIVKTTNRGQTWQTTAGNLTLSFYGIPVTVDHKAPDTLYSMSSDSVFKSTDFGSTWQTITRLNGLFDAPCDIEVFPDSNNVILAGDNTRGIMRSSDGGVTWSQVFVTSGEIPTIAVDHNRPGVAFATKWSGGGGFVKTTDYGKTWTHISTTLFSGRSMWGVHVDPKNSNWVITGEYSGGRSYLSTDGGETWRTITISSSNYSFVIADTNTIFAAQGNGFYKLRLPLVPVELTSFRYSLQGSDVVLNWETATESNNKGFEIEAGTSKEDLSVIGYVSGNGTTTEKKLYSYSFRPEMEGNYFVRLKQIDFDGTSEYSSFIEVDYTQEKSFALAQNYPNPFNPTAAITFSIPAEGYVTLAIYNTLGQQVMEAVSGMLSAGQHSYIISAAGLGSGNYYYRLNYKNQSGKSFASVRMMTVLK